MDCANVSLGTPRKRKKYSAGTTADCTRTDATVSSLRFAELPFCAVHNNLRTEDGYDYPVELEDPHILKNIILQETYIMDRLLDCKKHLCKRHKKPTMLPAEQQAAEAKLAEAEKQTSEDLDRHRSRLRVVCDMFSAECVCDKTRTSINDVPDMPLVHIFSFLDIISLVRMKLVCQRWNDLSKSGSLKPILYINTAQFPLHIQFWENYRQYQDDINKRFIRTLFQVPAAKKVRHIILRNPKLVLNVPLAYVDSFHEAALAKANLWTSQPVKQLFPNLAKLSLVDITGLEITDLQGMSNLVETVFLKSVHLFTFMDYGVEPARDWEDIGREVGIEIKECTLAKNGYWEKVWRLFDELVVPLTAKEEKELFKALKATDPEEIESTVIPFLSRMEPTFMVGKGDAHEMEQHITLEALGSFRPYTRRQLYESIESYACNYIESDSEDESMESSEGGTEWVEDSTETEEEDL